MKITIAGLGYLGIPLARELKLRSHDIDGTTTSLEKADRLAEENIPARIVAAPALPVLEADVLVLNIPPFEAQPGWFSRWDLRKVKKLIFVSSTSALKSNRILQEEEAWAKSSGPDALIVRPGGLIGRGRHPGKTLSGKKNLSGRLHPVNLIHVDDVVGFIVTGIEKNLSGEFNLVSDERHSREEFYSEFCRRSGLPVPEFDPADNSTATPVPNEALKQHYELKFPTMLGRSL